MTHFLFTPEGSYKTGECILSQMYNALTDLSSSASLRIVRRPSITRSNVLITPSRKVNMSTLNFTQLTYGRIVHVHSEGTWYHLSRAR
jgi:hypothetical protein